MHNNMSSLINKINKNFYGHLFSLFHLANDTYFELIQNPLYKAVYSKSLKSKLFRLCIFQQFEIGLIPSSFNLDATIQRVSNFDEYSLFLVGDTYQICFRKAYSQQNLYQNPPKYLMNRALNNNFNEQQLLFNPLDYIIMDDAIDNKYLFILHYELKNNKVDKLYLTLPDQFMKVPLYFRDLSNEYRQHCNLILLNEETKNNHEVQIARLKESVTQLERNDINEIS